MHVIEIVTGNIDIREIRDRPAAGQRTLAHGIERFQINRRTERDVHIGCHRELKLIGLRDDRNAIVAPDDSVGVGRKRR